MGRSPALALVAPMAKTTTAEALPQLFEAEGRRHSVGVAMLGGNPLRGRKKHDFYATPPDVFLAVKPRLGLGRKVHEFCCGDGAIGRLLEGDGHQVIATDLHDRGYGWAGFDALEQSRLMAEDMVTNPPFNIAPRLISHYLPLRPRVFALLLKSTFWHAKKRIPLFRRHPPSTIYALSWRPDFESLGRPTLEMVWVVWRRDHVGPTAYDILERPPGYAEAERAERAVQRACLRVVAGTDAHPPTRRPRKAVAVA